MTDIHESTAGGVSGSVPDASAEHGTVSPTVITLAGPSPGLADMLGRYLVARGEARANRVKSVLGKLTKRERALVREVAVMAAVQATMACGGKWQQIPDSAVVSDAVSACLSMPDLYPTLARIDRRVGGES